ncbi:polysaccharide lyase family 1 protein [Uliginosibacterium sp. H3]|uniref:Polysaccharide lyase family 1 protein n=1 Tax=Uliginosibacterium silvisoli TaxID=3114758 RepID=A0ABU6K6K5_9RHOO|nr:polysaccharide lyase family 1 protein [Uliginosibacterium sp. H3]
MKFKHLKSAVAVAAVIAATQAIAGPVGYGAATTGGGSKAAVSVSTMAAMQAAIDAYDGTSGLVLSYTGTFNFASITDVCTQWKLDAQTVEIKGKSNITIRGANGSSANFGIHVAGASSNIIIQNMTIGLLRGGEAADSISLEGMSSGIPSNIWVDHNTIFASLTECSGAGDASFDGGIDLKKGVKNVTISYNYIHDYQKVSLNGYSDSDTAHDAARTTYHHNRFETIKSRLPLQRRGLTHIYNNYFNDVHTSGINVRMGGMSLIESNYFENIVNPVTSRDSEAIGYWDLRNNYVGANITWTASESTSKPWVNATNWTTTKAFGSTGYAYMTDSAACVKNIAIATAGAATNMKESNGSCSGTAASSSSSSAASSSVASSSSSSSVASSSSSSVASSSSSSAASSSAASSSSSSASGAPVLSGTGDYPTGFSKCADLGGTCSVSSGTGWVAFGRKGKWVTKYVGVGSSVACTVAAFGSDPLGNPNKCSTQN